jgi:hypothetical protein
VWTLHRISDTRQALNPDKFGPVPKVSCRLTLSSAQTFVAPNPRRGQHSFEPIECLEDGASSGEALTTDFLDAAVAAGRIMEDADAEEVTLQHIIQHLL